MVLIATSTTKDEAYRISDFVFLSPSAKIWYSPLMFGTKFRMLAHPGRKPGRLNGDIPVSMSAAFGSLMSIPFFCLLLSIAAVRTAGEGMLWGAAVSLLFVSGLNAGHDFFEGRPLALLVLQRGCHTMSLMLIGLALGALCGSG